MQFLSIRTLRHRGCTVGVACAMALAGCGGSGDGDLGSLDTVLDTTPADTEPEERSADTTAAATAASTTSPEVPTTSVVSAGSGSSAEPPATEPPVSEPPPAPGGAECLDGEWLITNAEMNMFYDAIEANLDVDDFEINVSSGAVGLTLTGDTYEYTADFLLEVLVVGTTGSGAVTGSVSGTWEVADGTIITTFEEGALDVEVTAAGQTFSGSDMANGLLASFPISDAPFDCTGPTIDFQTGEGTPRHPVLLTPA